MHEPRNWFIGKVKCLISKFEMLENNQFLNKYSECQQKIFAFFWQHFNSTSIADVTSIRCYKIFQHFPGLKHWSVSALQFIQIFL